MLERRIGTTAIVLLAVCTCGFKLWLVFAAMPVSVRTTVSQHP